MKKIIMLFLSLVMTLVFCSCESENVKNAKAAYEEGKYSEVVELLSQEEDLNDSSKDMLTVSEANVLYDNKDYVEAVKKLAESNDGIQSEQFGEWFKVALEDCIANKSSDGIIELLAVDDSKSDVVYDAVTKACNNKDYNGFITLDGLVEGLEGCDLKTKLDAFSDEFAILRAEAFLVGTWERHVDGIDKNCRVKIMPYNDNLIGRVTRVGDDQQEFHFKKDDIMMQDFEFESGKKFLYSGLIKYTDGTSERQVISATINYKKDTYSVTISGNVVQSEYTYTRVK